MIFVFCFLILKNVLLETQSTTGIFLKSKNMHILCSKSVGMLFMIIVHLWCKETALKRGTSQVLKNDLCESTEDFYSSVLWSWEGTERRQHCHLLWHPLSSKKEETGNLLREHCKGAVSWVNIWHPETSHILSEYWHSSQTFLGLCVCVAISVVHSVRSAWVKGSAITMKNSPTHSNTCVNTLLWILYEVTWGV